MIKRLAIYLNEMFPITSFVGTMLTAFAIQLVYLRLSGMPAQFHWQMILSGLVITSVTLLIRVMDEFKDFEDDKRNFPKRPLPSGRVKKEDLKILAGVCVALILGLSLFHLKLLLFALITLAFTLLMLKWFFIEERMRKSLLLAFISHHPIVLFNFVYLVLGLTVSIPGINWDHIWYVLPIALIFTNWELCRKIRAPEGETEYTTYSKIFGPRVAIVLSIILQLIYITLVNTIFIKIQAPSFLQIVFTLVMILLAIPSLRFLISLKLKGPLKTNAESQVLVVIAFLIAASLL